MEYTEHYDNMEQRNALCSVANSKGFRMLHDNFDEDWQRGDEPHGTLIFTDEPAPQAPDEPSEIDLIKADVGDLKVRVNELEKK